MDWTQDKQRRFDELRRAELRGPLEGEQAAELAHLTHQLEQEELATLAPAMTTLRRDLEQQKQHLARMQGDNEELAKLRAQQERLVADARRWLAELEQRQQMIHHAFTQLLGDPVPA